MAKKLKLLQLASRRRWCFGSFLFVSYLAIFGAMLLNPLEAAFQKPRIAPGPFEIQIQDEGKPVVGALVHLGGRFAATADEGRVVFDGVPAGEYTLHVEHYDYERHDQQVQLPAGRREILKINLLTAPVYNVQGTVILDCRSSARMRQKSL